MEVVMAGCSPFTRCRNWLRDEGDSVSFLLFDLAPPGSATQPISRANAIARCSIAITPPGPHLCLRWSPAIRDGWQGYAPEWRRPAHPIADTPLLPATAFPAAPRLRARDLH